MKLKAETVKRLTFNYSDYSIKRGDVVTFPTLEDATFMQMQFPFKTILVNVIKNGRWSWIYVKFCRMFCHTEHLYNGILDAFKDVAGKTFTLEETYTHFHERVYERPIPEISRTRSAHVAYETRLKYLRLDELAQQEDVWDDRLLVKIPKAGSIPDIDYYAFQCFLADFKGIEF